MLRKLGRSGHLLGDVVLQWVLVVEGVLGMVVELKVAAEVGDVDEVDVEKKREVSLRLEILQSSMRLPIGLTIPLLMRMMPKTQSMMEQRVQATSQA